MLTLVRLSSLFVLAFGACTSHEGAQPDAPDRGPQLQFRGAIASVALIQECPDKAPSSPAAPGPASREMMPRGEHPGAALDSGPGWSPPCTQSTMQLTLSHDGSEIQGFAIKAARLTAAGTGAHLASVALRGPTRWDDAGRYVAWDEKLPPSRELKASYKLGEPDWSLVSKALGKDDTFEGRYVLELDVGFAGRMITLRSAEFQREYPHVVVT